MSEAEFADVTPDARAEPEAGQAPDLPAPPDLRVQPGGVLPARAARPRNTRGATGRGVIALIVVVTVIGGLADLMISGHRGHLFGVTFVIASAVGALVVRRRDLPTAMIAPPLLYCVLILAMSLLDQGGLTGGLATREAFYLGNAFVTGAPSIWLGTALAVGIGWYRGRPVR